MIIATVEHQKVHREDVAAAGRTHHGESGWGERRERGGRRNETTETGREVTGKGAGGVAMTDTDVHRQGSAYATLWRHRHSVGISLGRGVAMTDSDVHKPRVAYV